MAAAAASDHQIRTALGELGRRRRDRKSAPLRLDLAVGGDGTATWRDGDSSGGRGRTPGGARDGDVARMVMAAGWRRQADPATEEDLPLVARSTR